MMPKVYTATPSHGAHGPNLFTGAMLSSAALMHHHLGGRRTG